MHPELEKLWTADEVVGFLFHQIHLCPRLCHNTFDQELVAIPKTMCLMGDLATHFAGGAGRPAATLGHVIATVAQASVAQLVALIQQTKGGDYPLTHFAMEQGELALKIGRELTQDLDVSAEQKRVITEYLATVDDAGKRN